jgi:hypothetical protein
MASISHTRSGFVMIFRFIVGTIVGLANANSRVPDEQGNTFRYLSFGTSCPRLLRIQQNSEVN